MIHALFLAVGVFMVLWGVVICAMLVAMSLKAAKAIWLITVPGVAVVAFLALDFACHIFRTPRHVVPHQVGIASGIRWAIRGAAILLLLLKLYEFRAKRRARAARSSE